jgi:hypothetical protein
MTHPDATIATGARRAARLQDAERPCAHLATSTSPSSVDVPNALTVGSGGVHAAHTGWRDRSDGSGTTRRRLSTSDSTPALN